MFQIPKDGGSPTKLVDVLDTGCPILVDDTNIYWIRRNYPAEEVMVTPKTGGMSLQLASGDDIRHLAMDEAYIYWADSQSGTVMKSAKDGGELITLADGLIHPKTIAVDETAVYCVNTDGELMMIPLIGGSVTVLATGPKYPNDMAIDESNIYWTVGQSNDPSRVMKFSKPRF